MKKEFVAITVLIIMILGVSGVLFITRTNKNITSDELKFKEEYESLNNTDNGNRKTYLEVNIEEDNNIEYIGAKKVIKLIESGTGIIYFGFPECPWCRNAVPVLLEAAKKEGVSRIYYANLLSIRDSLSKDEDGNIITEKEGTKEYKKIVELLGNNLGSYEGLDDDSIKRLYFPTVLFLENGTVADIHISTVDKQTDPYKKLTKKQREELLYQYRKGIKETKSITCSADSKC